MKIAKCKSNIANCKLQIANCKLRIMPAIKICLAATRRGALTALFVALCNSALAAGSSEAVGKVREGIAQFEGGDFKAAAEAFSAADEALPKELRIAFDRGCAYAAGGEYDKAVEQFQKAAAATDYKLAALAQYNLGSVAVAKAQAQAGKKPEEAVGESRTAILESLAQAARHYRDCLGIAPENSDARYNLETIRLWVKHIQDVWRKRDRQKRRDEMNLLQYLEWWETQQRSLRQTSKELDAQKSSPQQREAIRAAENHERDLSEEIGPLKAKIAAASGASQQPGNTAAAQLSGDAQKAVELLSRLADQVGQTMNKAADSLGSGNLAEAYKSQTEAVEMIDQIFMAVSPYANLVQRGIDRQEELINQEAENSEGAEEAWNERFIARYGRILSAKARLELEQLESKPGVKQQPQAQPQAEDDAQSDDNNKSPPEKTQTGADDRSAADQQQRDMKEALKMGITSAPKVEKLAEEAAVFLEENNHPEALPNQQEALKLLKDMLPKQQQERKDQENKEQKNKDQKNKEQEKKNQEQKDQDKKDQNKKDQQQNQQQQQEQQKKQEQQNRDQETTKAGTQGARSQQGAGRSGIKPCPAAPGTISGSREDPGRISLSAGKGG